jgi:hypothetical protein
MKKRITIFKNINGTAMVTGRLRRASLEIDNVEYVTKIKK